MKKNKGVPTEKAKLFEWLGVASAIVYSSLIAFNIGAEFLGFFLLLISAVSLGAWGYSNGHKGGFFWLQVFYATVALVGMVRWF